MSKLLTIRDRETSNLAAYLGNDDRIKVSANGVIIDLADLLKGLPAAFYSGNEGLLVTQLDEHDEHRLELLRKELWE